MKRGEEKVSEEEKRRTLSTLCAVDHKVLPVLLRLNLFQGSAIYFSHSHTVIIFWLAYYVMLF